MTGNSLHRTILAMTAFLGVTGVAGGVGLLSGVLSPGLEQLDGSPFDTYTMPGLVLFGIGLVAVVGTLLTYRRHNTGIRIAGIAGALIMAFEVVQVVYIDFHILQPFYFVLGTLMLLISVWLSRTHSQLRGEAS